LKNADINLGKACNNRCLFCANGEPTKEERRWARAEHVEREMDRHRQEGAESVGFLGGEPTLYPHLERIIAHARKVGFQRISICTNASRLADRERLERFLDAGLTRVAVSIHSHLEAVEDGITRRRGSFAEKVKALRNLVAMKARGRLPDGLSLNTVLHGKNVDSLDAFVRFMQRLGVGNIRFNFIRPSHLAEKSRAWIPPLDRVTEAIRRLLVLNESSLHMQLNFADIPLCKLPWEVLANRNLLHKYVGENWDLATEVTHVRRQPSWDAPAGVMRFNWQQRRQEFKNHPAGCAGCVLRGSCEGVWQKYLDLYGSSEFGTGPALVEACLP